MRQYIPTLAMLLITGIVVQIEAQGLPSSADASPDQVVSFLQNIYVDTGPKGKKYLPYKEAIEYMGRQMDKTLSVKIGLPPRERSWVAEKQSDDLWKVTYCEQFQDVQGGQHNDCDLSLLDLNNKTIQPLTIFSKGFLTNAYKTDEAMMKEVNKHHLGESTNAFHEEIDDLGVYSLHQKPNGRWVIEELKVSVPKNAGKPKKDYSDSGDGPRDVTDSIPAAKPIDDIIKSSEAQPGGDNSVFITPDSAVSITFPRVGPVTNSVNRLNYSNDDGTNIHRLPPVTQYTWQTTTKGSTLYALMEIKNLSKPLLAVNKPKWLIFKLFFSNSGPFPQWSVKTTRGHKVETLDGMAKNGSPLQCYLSSFGGETVVVAACVLSGSDHPSVESQQKFLDSMTFPDDSDDDNEYRQSLSKQVALTKRTPPDTVSLVASGPSPSKEEFTKLAPNDAIPSAVLWEKGAALFNEGKYKLAQQFFQRIILSYPKDEYVPLATFYNADCYFWMERWDDAANAYQSFYHAFPKHERVPNAMFQKGVCLFRKGAYDDSVADFKAFLAKYPNHPLAKTAKLNIDLANKKSLAQAQ